MQRSNTGLRMALFLAVASGSVLFAWSAHDFGQSCGFRLSGYPSGPTTTADVLLIALPAVIVAAIEHLRIRSWRRVLGYAALSAALAAVAVAIAIAIWVVSRHCGE